MSKEIIELKEGFTRNQSNVSKFITEARSKMSANELKAFYQAVTLIQMDDKDFKEYEISVSDFSKSLNISNDNKSQIISMCRSLIRQVFEIIQPNGSYLAYTIFSKIHYLSEEQKIRIKFNDDMKPYLLALKRNFTKIQQVKYIKSFESKYTIRIYALLKDYRKMSQRDINLEALSKMLSLPASITSSYTRLCQRVLSPAMKEINEKSDIFINQIEIIGKRGKKITDIRIHFCNQSDKMSFDYTSELIKQYKKLKSFQPFYNCFYALLDEPKSTNDLYKITEIQVKKDPLYYSLVSNGSTLLSSPDKIHFLSNVANGIYRAALFIYEKEKQEQLPTLEWQDKQDRQKRIKEIIASWQIV